MPNDAVQQSPGEAFEELIGILNRLRDPGGCPWDREQTFASLRPYLAEETAEALEALDHSDYPHLGEELGDILLQIVFLSRLGSEQKTFTILDVVQGINRKMVSRHPHVFGDATADSAEEVSRRWETLKAAEKPARADQGVFAGIPVTLSALSKAQKTLHKVSKAGFKWPSREHIWRQIEEERAELAEAAAMSDRLAREARMEEEYGDMLFAMTGLAEFHGIDAERALRLAAIKFQKRFENLTQILRESGKTLADLTDEEKVAAWKRYR